MSYNKIILPGLLMLFFMAGCGRVEFRRGSNHPTLQAETPAVTMTSLPTEVVEVSPTPAPALEPTVQPTEPDAFSMPSHDLHMHGEASAQAMAEHHIQSGPHIQLTPHRTPSPKDLQRAEQIADQAREALAKYADFRAALRDGFVVFAPDVPQDVYHFVNWREALKNMDQTDPARPTALLYEKVEEGYKWVGVMYSAPYHATEAALDRRFPLSVAQWHAHVNICLPPENEGWDSLIDDPKFGFEGSINTEAECEAEGGRFLPDAFGWMVHVDLFESE